MDFDTITTELQNLRFNKSSARRQSVGRKASERDKKDVYYFIAGYIRNYKGVWDEKTKTNVKKIQVSNATYYPKNQRVIEYAKALMLQHDPDFKYTSIQFARNMKTDKHKDKSNIGESYIISLGQFQGGELRIYEADSDEYTDVITKNRFYKFNANQTWHETCEWSGGDRYTITWFTVKPYD